MAAITTLRNGVPIGYDPETQKWFAEIDGKRTTSQDFSTLINRVDGRKKVAQKAHVEIFEVTTLALGTGSSIHPTPVKLQLQWNGETGNPEIKKYLFLTPGQGWRESDRKTLVVVNPFSLPAALKSHFAESALTAAADQAYRIAERAVATAWSEAKINSSATYRYQTHHTPGLADGDDKDIAFSKKVGDTRNVFTVDKNAPMAVVPKNLDIHNQPEWTTTPEGHWEHNSGTVRVRLNISQHSYLSFDVEEKSEKGFQKVYETQDFNEALTVALLTHRFKEENAITSWESMPDGVVQSKSVSWPPSVDVRGTVFVTDEKLTMTPARGTVSKFQLRREKSNPLNDHHSEKNEWKWVKKDGASHGSTLYNYLVPGPEDQAIDSLLVLKQTLMSFQKATPDPDLTNWTKPAGGETKESLKANSQEWIASLYEANLNGEWENPSEEAIRERLQQTMAAMAAAVGKNPDLVAFRAASAEMAANAEVIVAPPVPRLRGPRPGR